MGVVAGSFGDLEHHGRLLLLAGLDDGLEQLHIVHVERAKGVLAFERFREQIVGVGQWHSVFRF